MDGVGAIGGFIRYGAEYNVYDLAGYDQREAAVAIYDNDPNDGVGVIDRYNPTYDSSTIVIPNVPSLPPAAPPRLSEGSKELQAARYGAPSLLRSPFGTGATPGGGTQLQGIAAHSGFSIRTHQYNVYDLPGYSELRAAVAIYDNDPRDGLGVINWYNPSYDSSMILIPNVPGLPVVPVP